MLHPSTGFACFGFICFVGIIDKHKAGLDPLKRKVGSGRPRKTTRKEDKAIVRLARKQPFSSVPALIRDGEELSLSKWTVIRRLKEVCALFF